MCLTQWTVRGDAIESIMEHYDTLSQLWDECLETRLDPNIKGRIIGVQTQMTTFDLLFGLQLSMKFLKITDNLSRTLQKQSMSAAEGQAVAELTVKTLKSRHTDGNFNAFFSLCNYFCKHYNINLPTLPWKRKAPKRYEIGTEEGSHSTTVEDQYHQAYFEVLDLAIASISDRFNQPGYSIYSNLKIYLSVQLIIKHIMISLLMSWHSMGMILIHHNYLCNCKILEHFFQGMLKRRLCTTAL